jgi:ankyrin repeat protein
MLQTKFFSSGVSLFSLIDRGSFQFIKKNIESFNLKALSPYGKPPVIYALEKLRRTQNYAYENLAWFFIEQGADIFQKDAKKRSALAWAILADTQPVASLLIKKGLDAYETNQFGFSGIHYWFSKKVGIKLRGTEMEKTYQQILLMQKVYDEKSEPEFYDWFKSELLGSPQP